MKFRFSLDWLLIFVPIALVASCPPYRIQPRSSFCSAIAIIPVAGWIGRATEALASRVGEGAEDFVFAPVGGELS